MYTLICGGGVTHPPSTTHTPLILYVPKINTGEGGALARILEEQQQQQQDKHFGSNPLIHFKLLQSELYYWLLATLWSVCLSKVGDPSVYSTVHNSKVHYSIVFELQYSTLHYSTVQCNTVQYSTEQYSKVQYNTVQYSTVQYSTVQYSTLHYSTVYFNTVQYSTIQYKTVQYSTVQYINRSYDWLLVSLRSVSLSKVSNPSSRIQWSYSESSPVQSRACTIQTDLSCLRSM